MFSIKTSKGPPTVSAVQVVLVLWPIAVCLLGGDLPDAAA